MTAAEEGAAARFFLCFGSSAFISSSRPSAGVGVGEGGRKKKREEIAGAVRRTSRCKMAPIMCIVENHLCR